MTHKTVYLYNEATGEFTHAYDAQESPLEPGVFITPTHSTPTAPPTPSVTQAAVFANGAWTLVADFRGATWFDQNTGDPTLIVALGTPASDLAPTEPAFIVAARAKAAFVASASSALAQSDLVVIRSAENGKIVPTAWVTYRNALRAIVNGSDTTSNSLPTAPAYPA